MVVQHASRYCRAAITGADLPLLVVGKARAGDLQCVIGADLAGSVGHTAGTVHSQCLLCQQLATTVIQTGGMRRDVLQSRDGAIGVVDDTCIQRQCAVADDLSLAVAQILTCGHGHGAIATLGHLAGCVVQHSRMDVQRLVNASAYGLYGTPIVGEAVRGADGDAACVAADGAGVAVASAVVQSLAAEADIPLRCQRAALIVDGLLHIGSEAASSGDGAPSIVQVMSRHLQAVLVVKRARNVAELVELQAHILCRQGACAVIQGTRAAQVAQLHGAAVGQALTGRQIGSAIGNDLATSVADLVGDGDPACGQGFGRGDHH